MTSHTLALRRLPCLSSFTKRESQYVPGSPFLILENRWLGQAVSPEKKQLQAYFVHSVLRCSCKVSPYFMLRFQNSHLLLYSENHVHSLVKLFFSCVYVCVPAHMFKCVYACTPVHPFTCVGRSDVFSQSSPLYLLKQGLLLNPELNNPTILASQLAPDMPCLCFLCGGTTWLVCQQFQPSHGS